MMKSKEKTKLLCAAGGLIQTLLTIAAHAQSPLDSLGCNYLEEIFPKITNPQNATAIYYQSLKNLETPSQKNAERLKRLEADVTDIMAEEERIAYKNLKSAAEKVAFFQRFWLMRDLTPATETNERLLEHYARLAYARRRYFHFDSRGYDDRGEVYVRYGPPDNYVIDSFHHSSAPIETWAYYFIKTPVTFDFIDKGHGYRLAWRFDEGIKMFDPGSRFAAIGDLLRERAFLSPAYTSLFLNFLTIAKQVGVSAESLRLMEVAISEYANENYNVQVNLPQITSDILKDISDLPFSARLAMFREGERGHSVVVAYGFKASDLKSETRQLVLAAAVKDTNLLTFDNWQDTVRLSQTSFDATGEMVGVFQQTLSAGHYFVFLDFKDSTAQQRGLKDFAVTLRDETSRSLQLSSVLFAREVQLASERFSPKRALTADFFLRHGLAIKPYPFPVLPRAAPIFVYFEICDLQQDESGETHYELEYEVHAPPKKGLASFWASLNPFGGRSRRVSVVEERRGNASLEPTYLRLDFSRLGRGKYDLVVRVTDRLANLRRESKLEFELE